MLDINFIKENKETVKKAAKDKNREIDIERLLEVDKLRRELITKVEKIRSERNILSKSKRSSLLQRAIWSIGLKLNSGISPHFLTSLLNEASGPTGTLLSGIFGT